MGQTNLPGLTRRDIDLQGRPEWVIGSPYRNGILWTVQMSDRSIKLITVIGDRIAELTPPRTPYRSPALVYSSGFEASLHPFNYIQSSNSSTPSNFGLSDSIALIYSTLDLGVFHKNNFFNFEIKALPDSRIVHDKIGTIVVLTDPTDAYAHGVLGDDLEAKSFTVVNMTDNPPSVTRIRMEQDWVIEGTSALFHDWNDDGEREILVTRSRSGDGGQLALYSTSGKKLATSASIGRSFRWRHQLAVANILLEGDTSPQPTLISVLTPHIGGVIEAFRWQGNQLVLKDRLPGFTSHIIGTRNLDMAVMGQFLPHTNQRSPQNLLIPNQAKSHLGIISFSQNGPKVENSLELRNRIITNISATQDLESNIAVAVGTSDGFLNIWQTTELPQSPYLQLIKPDSLSVDSRPGQSYQILSSPDLKAWKPLQPITIPPSGNTSIQVPNTLPNQFFSIEQIQP